MFAPRIINADERKETAPLFEKAISVPVTGEELCASEVRKNPFRASNHPLSDVNNDLINGTEVSFSASREIIPTAVRIIPVPIRILPNVLASIDLQKSVNKPIISIDTLKNKVKKTENEMSCVVIVVPIFAPIIAYAAHKKLAEPDWTSPTASMFVATLD